MTSSVPRALFRYSFAVKQEVVVYGGFKQQKLSVEISTTPCGRAEGETADVLLNCILFSFIIFFFVVKKFILTLQNCERWKGKIRTP